MIYGSAHDQPQSEVADHETLLHSGWQITRGTYGKSTELESIVTAALREFTMAVDASSTELWLRGHGRVEYTNDGRDRPPSTRWHDRTSVDSINAVDAAVHAADWPSSGLIHQRPALPRGLGLDSRITVDYARRELGTLHIQWKHTGNEPNRAMLCHHFTEDLALLVAREWARRWSRDNSGEEHAFVGLSSSLRVIEKHIERLSQTELPVMIRGEYGTESLTAAIALHCGGPRRAADFVPIHCATADERTIAKQLEDAFVSEQVGTVFLYGVDDLPATAQRAVLDNIPLAMTSPVAVVKTGPRLIASTTRNLDHCAVDGLFSRTLLTELDVLSLIIPPLRERAADISDLVRHALRQQRGRHDPPGRHAKTCHDEVVQLMTRYPWPGNFFEFKRVLLQLAIMSEGESIRSRDVLRYAPQLLRPPATRPHDDESPARQPPRLPENLDEWVAAITNEEFDRFESVHEGLHRALVYMSKNYQQRMSLRELARRAHLSTSHLSYLFKSFVGTNFKTLLARLRIEKAKALLAPNGRQRRITDVAAESGFGDLSHFEKTFRRFVHMCPSKYRESLSLATPRP